MCGNISRARCLELSFATTRTARSSCKSQKVAATLPKSRNFSARLPRRQPVTIGTASVAQRSISTKDTSRLRSLPAGSSIWSRLTPWIAKRSPRIWPAHMWPCAISAIATYSSNVFSGMSQNPDRLRGEFDEPFLIIPLPLKIRPRHFHGDVARELEAYRLGHFRDPHQFDGNAIRSVLRRNAQIAGWSTHPDTIAEKSAWI